jgi:long-chain acyl-CoA synthetase
MAVEVVVEGVGRVAARLSRLLEVCLASQDLSLSQYRTLLFLADGSAAASALADRLAVTRPTVTAVVDGLVSRGLVERTSETGDRRRVSHVLTVEGRRVLAAADAAADARLSAIAGHLDPAGAEEAFRGLGRWSEALDALRAAKGSGR